MKSLQLQVSMTLNSESANALVEFLVLAVERGTAHCKPVTTPPGLVGASPETKLKMTPREASEHALFSGQNPEVEKELLIDTNQAAKLLRVSPRTIWAMSRTGGIPKPIRIGRAVRWNRNELQAWVDAGCPATSKWKWPR